MRRDELVRRERIPVSTIALTQFMQSLFEDKLASQEEALQQGKQAADIIELQEKMDGVDEGGPKGGEGRSKGDAPQIDGAVHIASRRPLRAGEIVTVKIEHADAYDLHGVAA